MGSWVIPLVSYPQRRVLESSPSMDGPSVDPIKAPREGAPKPRGTTQRAQPLERHHSNLEVSKLPKISGPNTSPK